MHRRIAFASSGVYLWRAAVFAVRTCVFSHKMSRSLASLPHYEHREIIRGFTREITRVCVPRAHKHTRARFPKAFQTLAVYQHFLSLQRAGLSNVRTVYQRFYRVTISAHARPFAIGRFVTPITGQAIKPYERRLDYAFSTIYNRDRYPIPACTLANDKRCAISGESWISSLINPSIIRVEMG